MTAPRTPGRRRLLVLDTLLRRAMWAVVVLGTVLGLTSTGFSATPAPQGLTLAVLSAFFPLACLRLVVAALLGPERRTARLVLVSGVALWAVGSIVLHQGGDVADKSFPGPAELFFSPSYAAFAAYLLLDASGRTTASRKTWLEAVLVCGGVTCLSASLLASPLGSVFGAEGLALLLAVVYPLLDLFLAVLVLGQVLLGARGLGRDTWLLVGAFAVLGASDVLFLLAAAPDTYFVNVVTDVSYGLAFALLVAAACAPRSEPVRQHSGRTRGNLLVGAGAVALLALVLRPLDSGAWFVTVPAVATLVATGARLLVALREAQGAAEARKLSRTDELTGLLNRRAILADVDARLRVDGPVSLMLLDLDGFKEVNDSLGHSAGDALLQEVGHRLVRTLPASSRVSRVGGDEFALMVLDDDGLSLTRLARQVRAVLSETITVDGLDLAVGASVGITSRLPEDLDAVTMLRRADVAMYRAKHARLGESTYDPAHDGFSRERLEQVESLRTGIADGQLVLWYQPQVDAATQQVTAVEALVRWEHPQHGLLGPLAFLPEARRAGLMPALTEAVVAMVVADARRWADLGQTFTVSFNCAPPELLGGRMVPALLDAVREAGLPPDRLLVEVTEDSFVTDPEKARAVLQELRRNRVQTAIDDYGTGFSSLAYLRDLPVQELKIDRSFVRTMGSDSSSRVIVESTLQMAHAMGLRVVAEGVEDASTAAELVACGVDVLQGYHIARPMPAAEVGAWVAEWRSALRTRAAR
ncbi:putative bifunctional diguanylate cyclase/phosphodiesterase [Aquipuribacter hungaricus]|uniref:Bifunctional diguanylate cyclase/phosphodiesterase n=1 Tax=Aquipuribacter hungaricus TaxID=545624 RepID=A0ABV7WJM0_9MICO